MQEVPDELIIFKGLSDCSVFRSEPREVFFSCVIEGRPRWWTFDREAEANMAVIAAQTSAVDSIPRA